MNNLRFPLFKTKLILWAGLFMITQTIFSQTPCYLVEFTDKTNTPHGIYNPATFLSQRAIDRRTRQGINLDETDLPVVPAYIDSLKKLNITILHTSKWMNAALVRSSNGQLMDTLSRVSFVKNVILNKGITTSPTNKPTDNQGEILKGSSADYSYGMAYNQIRTINGIPIHQQGFRGADMHIAVIDAGFYKANELPLLAHLYQNNKILGTKDFVNPASDIYAENAHGMHVLSIMGGYLSSTYCGTAPEASFWLLRTEDADSEFPIEGDFWVCAAEFADSAGVDVINTSLGYTTFDNQAMNLTYNNLDGNSRISKGADMAVNKGMVVVVSAGNDGSNSWRYISTPADAKKVLTVGAMRSDSTLATFSSVGPTSDNRIKPDVLAMGVSTAIQGTDGYIRTGNGTSYSSPVMAGMVACLWQSSPNLKATEVVELIRKHSNAYLTPTPLRGYGIPNFLRSYQTSLPSVKEVAKWKAWPNPFNTKIYLSNNEKSGHSSVEISLYNSLGTRLKQIKTSDVEIELDDLGHLPKGIYLLTIKQPSGVKNFKLIKE
jgi:subtilisin family serine protease